jgi:hypothetical protein
MHARGSTVRSPSARARRPGLPCAGPTAAARRDGLRRWRSVHMAPSLPVCSRAAAAQSVPARLRLADTSR